MNLSQLEERVRIDLAEHDDTGFFKTADITGWLNEGYLDVAAKAKCIQETASFNTTGGETKYTLPDNYIDEFMIYLKGYGPLDKIDMREKETEQGYYIWGNELIITPVSPDNMTLEVHYARKPFTLLVNDTDEPEIPEEHQHLLVNYTLYKAYMKDKQPNIAQAFYHDYLRGLAVLKQKYAKQLPRRKQWEVIR